MGLSWAVAQDLMGVGKERVAATPSSLGTILLPTLFVYYVMAVLVQLPRTRFYRVGILPDLVWLAARAGMTLDFSGKRPEYAYLNQGLALVMFTLVMRATAWTLAKEPYVKMTAVQEVNRKPIAQRSPPQPDGISAAAWNALDLCCNLRGIGWNWSEGVYFPEPMFKTDSRLFFTVLSLMRFMLYWTALDALDLSVKAFAPEGSAGWSIFDPSLPPVQRYLRSIFITGLSGFAAVAMIEVLYQFHAVLFTACFQQHPSLWPPLFDQPWFATSLANLWGKRWHQLFREYFSAVGTKPLEGILGQYSVIGAFVLSGLLHDIGLRGMGHGGDFLHVAGFFVVQGLGLVLERLWARLTGKRVGGILGGVWVWVWQLVWGVYLVNAWAEKGLIAKSEFFVAPYTPVTLLLNVLQKVLPKY